jgi:hypothetical protein
MQKIQVDDAYLVLDGTFLHSNNVKRLIRDGSMIFACKIKDKG